MSIDRVTSQLTSGIAKLVLGSFDRNIFRHQNRQLNEHKYFSLYFPESKSSNSLNPVFKEIVVNEGDRPIAMHSLYGPRL